MHQTGPEDKLHTKWLALYSYVPLLDFLCDIFCNSVLICLFKYLAVISHMVVLFHTHHETLLNLQFHKHTAYPN